MGMLPSQENAKAGADGQRRESKPSHRPGHRESGHPQTAGHYDEQDQGNNDLAQRPVPASKSQSKAIAQENWP
jgi:hypothetical protein